MTNVPIKGREGGGGFERHRRFLPTFEIFDKKSDFYPYFLPRYYENLTFKGVGLMSRQKEVDLVGGDCHHNAVLSMAGYEVRLQKVICVARG